MPCTQDSNTLFFSNKEAWCALQETRAAAEAEVAEIRGKVDAIEKEMRAKMAALSQVEERQAEREAELGLMVSNDAGNACFHTGYCMCAVLR